MTPYKSQTSSESLWSPRSLTPYGYNEVKIIFHPTVEVSASRTLYSSFGVLAQIGGSLGLYLGVAIIDSYKLVNKIISYIGKFLRKKIWIKITFSINQVVMIAAWVYCLVFVRISKCDIGTGFKLARCDNHTCLTVNWVQITKAWKLPAFWSYIFVSHWLLMRRLTEVWQQIAISLKYFHLREFWTTWSLPVPERFYMTFNF